MVKDMEEPLRRLTREQEQHASLATLATEHEVQNEKASQHDATQTVTKQNDALKGGASGSKELFPEPTRMVITNDYSVTSGRDTSISAGRSLLAVARNVISLFANLGMKLIATRGKVKIQAQGDEMNLASLKDLTIKSVNGKLVLAAEQEVGLYVGGTYIKLTPDSIQNGIFGHILERAASWSVTGPDTETVPMPTFPKMFDLQFILIDKETGQPIPNTSYSIVRANGEVEFGVTESYPYIFLPLTKQKRSKFIRAREDLKNITHNKSITLRINDLPMAAFYHARLDIC